MSPGCSPRYNISMEATDILVDEPAVFLLMYHLIELTVQMTAELFWSALFEPICCWGRAGLGYPQLTSKIVFRILGIRLALAILIFLLWFP